MPIQLIHQVIFVMILVCIMLMKIVVNNVYLNVKMDIMKFQNKLDLIVYKTVLQQIIHIHKLKIELLDVQMNMHILKTVLIRHVIILVNSILKVKLNIVTLFVMKHIHIHIITQ